jgi:hypothetical protein
MTTLLLAVACTVAWPIMLAGGRPVISFLFMITSAFLWIGIAGLCGPSPLSACAIM